MGLREFLDDIRISENEDDVLFHNPGNDPQDRYAIVKLKCCTELKEALSFNKRKIGGRQVDVTESSQGHYNKILKLVIQSQNKQEKKKK